MRKFPISLHFLTATAVIFAIQVIPGVGYLLFHFALIWSVPLINAGMIGTVIEALAQRVSRKWLVLPVAFYGGYYAFALTEHLALSKLSSSYAAANDQVTIPFNPERHALVFTDDGDDGSWLTQNYGLPVAYTRNANFPEGHSSRRIMPSDVCVIVSENPALNVAQIKPLGFSDVGANGSRNRDWRFCALDMPERPVLPVVVVSRKKEQIRQGTLLVTRITTTVTMPTGKRYTLLSGVAAPLSSFPMPIMECVPEDCNPQFWRDGFTPVLPGNAPFSHDSIVIAKSLGLKRVAPADRRGGDETLVREKIAEGLR